jgi:hypothetical protein
VVKRLVQIVGPVLVELDLATCQVDMRAPLLGVQKVQV